MTGEKKLQIIFLTLAILMLAAMLMISRDAGISGDEEVHYKQSEMVYNYFSTLGKDKSSLQTPVTNLKYYGQAFDNLVTILIHWFGIEDIYGFRHLMCSFSGWLTIFITALFAAWIAGYGAAILVMLLFAVSPTFLGHAQNNLKDIPFALAYIASIYYSLKLVFTEGKPSPKTILLLILCISFSIGIRAGGMIVIFYLGLFMLVKTFADWAQTRKYDPETFRKQLALFTGIVIAGYLLGLITWPYGLQNPILNPVKSYEVMTHYPVTVRQIFEGRFDWSDFLPWYYLPKYMGLTIPVIVFSGLLAFLLNTKKHFAPDKKLQLILLSFTILFPVAFVILKESNLYGSWRHFLFVYPGIILVSALGIQAFFVRFKHRITRMASIVLLAVLAVHPFRFMAMNHPYYYLYYNQFAGGLKGAYGNFETDYYYHTMRGGAEWLQQYLKNKPQNNQVIVGGNFPIHWYFRNDTTMKFVYFPWQNRSEYNWDYAIIANSYISAYQLKNKIWPPSNTIHTILADGVPVCAVVERVTKDDLYGIQQQNNEGYIKSALLFQNALKFDPENELIYTKFAHSLIGLKQDEQAEKILSKCLKINPYYEKALVLSGDLAVKRHDFEKAAVWYERTLQVNRKYFGVYPKLAEVYAETNVDRARKVLNTCLKLNPAYKPAIRMLADTYRESDPEMARKYDERMKKLK